MLYSTHDIEILEHSLIAKQGDADPVFFKGGIPILISVPHAVRHLRDGAYRKGELNTISLAYLIREQVNCHVCCNLNTEADPNYDAVSHYKERLKEYIEGNGIVFLLDLHGASVERRFDIEVGTAAGNNIPQARSVLDIIKYLAADQGFELDVDKFFTASGADTVSSFIHREVNIPAVQFEINYRNRDAKDITRFHKTADLIASYLKLVNRMDGKYDGYYVGKVRPGNFIQPINRIEIPGKYKTEGLYTEKEHLDVLSADSRFEGVVSAFTDDDAVYVTGRMYHAHFRTCNLVFLKKTEYREVSFFRPKIEEIENSSVLLSTDLYEIYSGYDVVEVFHRDENIKAYYRPKAYSSNINNRENAIWLSFFQRKLLNLEIPLVLSENKVQKLAEAIKPDDFAFFMQQYHFNEAAENWSIKKLDEDTFNRIKRIYSQTANKVQIKGLRLNPAVRGGQAFLLEKTLRKKPIHLRAVRCSENDESIDAIRLTKSNLQVLGIEDGDKVLVTHKGKSISVRALMLDRSDFAKIIQINNLQCDEDIELVACIPIKYRSELEISDINICVAIERDLKYLLKKNISTQLIAVLGTFIAIFGLPELSYFYKAVLFIGICPVIIYSILAKEREKV